MAEALNQVLENQDPQYKQLIELLNNISPEDLQSLAENGIDLKNLSNIDDLNNLIQYCESIGGVENLFQALSQIQEAQDHEHDDNNRGGGEDQEGPQSEGEEQLKMEGEEDSSLKMQNIQETLNYLQSLDVDENVI
jgi:hypothetical protein